MKSRFIAAAVPALFSLWQAQPALALEGEPYIHDPSTVVECDGKWYAYGTGGGGLISEDGWTWHSGAQRPGGGAAPDAMKLGDRYLVIYGSTGGGMYGGHNGSILTMWTKSLDPQSPDFKFTEAKVVASSDGIEDCDSIDPSLLLDPTTGRLWASYGTYFGFIRVVELDPKTALRVEGNKAVNVAIDCEATDLVYRDGWYYLFGTHGTCCAGANSTYNIRVGRSKSVTGPYLDNLGNDMIKGGGKLVAGANGHLIGAGHFGREVLEEGVEKFSCHYEADLDRSSRSVLDVRALLWKDGWPLAGDDFKGGTFQIQSERTGYALELSVDELPMGGGRGGGMGMGGRGRRGGPEGAAAPGGTNTPAAAPATGSNAPAPGAPGMGGFGARGPGMGGGMGGGMGMGGRNSGPATNVPLQTLAQDSAVWPQGNINVCIGDYMLRPHQQWAITAVTNVPGYLGSPYFKITIAGTERALAATEEGEVIAVPAFTGAAEQLWRIDQLTDGTWRIMPKVVPNSKEPMALTAAGYSTPTLAKFDAKSDKARWNLKAP